jgi:hypothetical protein
MLKRGLVVALALWLLTLGPAWGANTVTKAGNFIHITFDGATDLDFSTDSTINLPKGCYLQSINVKAAAANNVMTVRHNGATGVPMFLLKDVQGGSSVMYFNGASCKPYIKGTEVSAGITAVFQLK